MLKIKICINFYIQFRINYKIKMACFYFLIFDVFNYINYFDI